MELLGLPSGVAAAFPFLRPRCFTREEPHSRFILRSRRLSAPPPPLPLRAQLDPSSKHIPKAQSAPDGLADDSDDSLPPAAKKDVSRRNLLQSRRSKAKDNEAIEQLDKQLSEGVKPPYVEYLMDLGLDLQDIKRIVEIYPYIQYRSVDEQVGGVSIEKKIMKKMAYFESLGMDKAQCVKAFCRGPRLLTLNREKIEINVAYFLELGVSAENIGKMIVQSPQLFGMSVEEKIKPTTEFFLDKGFTMEELIKIAARFAPIYNLSLTKSLIPKWEFFLEMGYPRSFLVSFPQYFGYSLEDRIKPRYMRAKEHGVQFHSARLFHIPNRKFEKFIKDLVSRSVKDDGEYST